jgi:osmotically-inducible protein OsmY
MKTDLQLQRDVTDELYFEPTVDPADIGVAANDGVVTLSGKVKSYAEKWSAVRAAERTWGVKAVVDKMELPKRPLVNA